MGAEFQMDEIPEGVGLAEAFRLVQDRARYDHGHAGYSGTIAEADGFQEVLHPEFATMDDASAWADAHAEKWGPALVVSVKGGKKYFAGIYSC
jgi:hypothetical protein